MNKVSRYLNEGIWLVAVYIKSVPEGERNVYPVDVDLEVIKNSVSELKSMNRFQGFTNLTHTCLYFPRLRVYAEYFTIHALH